MTRARLAALILTLWASAPVGAETIDTIVVTVGGEAITLSRVRFMKVFIETTRGEGLGRPLEDGPRSDAEVQRILEDDAIIFALASRLPMMEAAEDEIDARLAWFSQRFPSDADLEAFIDLWGFDVGEQRRFFARRVMIEKFIALKIGLFDDVPERELRAWYQERSQRYPAGWPQARAEVTADYAREHQGSAYAAWITAYRKNHSEMMRVPDAGPKAAVEGEAPPTVESQVPEPSSPPGDARP